MSTALPIGANRSVSHVDEVFVSDRDGNEYGQIEIEPFNPNWDIDRSGSKGQVEVTTHRRVLTPNMWIRVYRTVIPETGEIVRYPLGHWRLGKSSELYSGSLALDTGEPHQPQHVFGTDIIDTIANVRLRETFYTPKGGNVMSDVRTLIKLATMGNVGPNLLPNGGFEDELSGWSTGWYGGGATSSNITVTTLNTAPFAIPEGNRFLAVNCTASAPAGAFRGVYRSIDLPTGASAIYVSARVRIGHATSEARISFDFIGRNGATIAYQENALRVDELNQFYSVVEGMLVPPDAVSVNIGLINKTLGTGVSHWIQWDDVRAGTCTRLAVPDDQMSLPRSAAVAANRIQTPVTKNILFDAINADRLSAIAHQALYTTLNSKITTSPLRVLADATPKRSFGPRDLRIIGEVEIPEMPTDVPNHFTAIKESFEEGVSPLYAEAWNNNPHDEFSLVRTGEMVSADPIYVQDAVDQASLQAVAESARDRFSTQEEIHFTIYPDFELTVYDVVEILDPDMPRAMGKWLIQYIGIEGPVMEVSARRAVGGG